MSDPHDTGQILPFQYGDAELRTLTISNEPWFVAPDACRMLDLRDTSSALKMVDDEDKRTLRRSEGPHFPQGLDARVHTITVVNESGMYALIFQSNKDEARKVRRWITGTVLPEIRKTGSYSPAPALTPAEQMAHGLLAAQELLALRDERIAELEPKARGDYSVKDAADTLTRAGIKTGQSRLFADLQQRGWIHRAKGDGRWRVYASAIETGYMSVIPTSHYHPKTGVLVLDPPQPRVTPKGLRKLLDDYGVANSARQLQIGVDA